MKSVAGGYNRRMESDATVDASVDDQFRSLLEGPLTARVVAVSRSDPEQRWRLAW